jgi:hypothetical protein
MLRVFDLDHANCDEAQRNAVNIAKLPLDDIELRGVGPRLLAFFRRLPIDEARGP